MLAQSENAGFLSALIGAGLVGGAAYLALAYAKPFDPSNPGVQKWLARNPPPPRWLDDGYTPEEWARLEMPVWHIEGLNRLRGSPAAHAARTRARIAKAMTMAQKSLQHSACIPRKRTLIRAMRELARADENAEWAADPEQLDMAFDAVMIAAREWQSDCG
jgi:hypothetical protein